MDEFRMRNQGLVARQSGEDRRLSLIGLAQGNNLLAGNSVANDEHSRHIASIANGCPGDIKLGLLLGELQFCGDEQSGTQNIARIGHDRLDAQ